MSPTEPTFSLSFFGRGLYLGLFAGLAAATSCDGTLAHIDVKTGASAVVEGATLLEQLAGDMGFGDFVSMDLAAEEELANQGVGPGDIKDVRLIEFALTVTDPQGGDLSWLESMELYVEAPGVERALIASADSFPEGVASVSFDLYDVDLTPYAVSEEMTLATEVSGRRPDNDTTIQADVVLDVGVTGQGACNQAKAARANDSDAE
ncbi:hypothetical protein L6R46_02435 [Myxococcota bacterium]|jgi:hypothetical protein|nr:hypothetical protein [Myxococcota bacterium]